MRKIILVLWSLVLISCHADLRFTEQGEFKSEAFAMRDTEEINLWSFPNHEIRHHFENRMNADVNLSAENFDDYVGLNGAHIDEGRIFVWRPVGSQIGQHVFEVSFRENNIDKIYRYNIKVMAVVHNKNQMAYTNRLFSMQIGIKNYSGEILGYQIINAPIGMTIDEKGIINWVPTVTQLGLKDVMVRVYDFNDNLNQEIINFGVMVEKDCMNKQILGIFRDDNNNDYPEAGEFIDEVISFKGTESAKDFFNRFSSNAESVVGAKLSGKTEFLFFYEGADGLNLNFLFAKDVTGQIQSSAKWEILTFGNAKNDRVIFSDDSGELVLRDSGENFKMYDAHFDFTSNGDGGILGSFIAKSYRIIIHNLVPGDLKHLVFYSANGGAISLNRLGESEFTATGLIIQYKTLLVCNF